MKNCECCGEPAGIRVDQFHAVCSDECRKEWERDFPPKRYLQCTNCDYICTESEIVKADGRRRCPWCNADSEFDPVKESYDEIYPQLQWQKEMKEKGIVYAYIERRVTGPKIPVSEESS